VDPQLSGWANFYVIVGSSAGALIGLMFVVIALLGSTRTQAVSTAMRAFATPTIVYFSSVLLMAGLSTMPHHTRTSLSIVWVAVGAVGVAYVATVARHMGRQENYSPDRGDWLWFVFLPAAAYACVLIGGATIGSARGTALDMAGGSVMLLLLVGVHNAWDSAVWMVANPPAGRD
jgi:hypothetical protein